MASILAGVATVIVFGVVYAIIGVAAFFRVVLGEADRHDE